MTATAPLDPADLGTVLGVWAHPDDEAYLAAGLTARLTDAGHRVAVVTATRGEHGTDDPATWPPARLGRRRAHELRASLAVVGVSDHRFLDHVDGTLPDVDPAIGSGQVRDAIDRVRPDTIVTFGPDGMTGHPDHVTVSRWVDLACARHPAPPRVLHATTTEEFVARWADLHAATGAFDAPGLPLATPQADVAVEVRLDDVEQDRKLAALAAQASQVAPMLDRIGETTLRSWWAVESFTLAPASGRPDLVLVASRA